MRHEGTRNAVLDLFQRAVVARRDHGEAGGTGFGDHMRHALVTRQPDEEIEPGQEGRNVGAVAEEGEPPRETERGGEEVKLLRIIGHEGIGAADHHETGSRPGLGHERRGPDEVLDSLLAVEPADPADHGRIGGDAEQDARPRAIGRRGTPTSPPSRGSRARDAPGPASWPPRRRGWRRTPRHSAPSGASVRPGLRTTRPPCSISGGRRCSRSSAG